MVLSSKGSQSCFQKITILLIGVGLPLTGWIVTVDDFDIEGMIKSLVDLIVEIGNLGDGIVVSTDLDVSIDIEHHTGRLIASMAMCSISVDKVLVTLRINSPKSGIGLVGTNYQDSIVLIDDAGEGSGCCEAGNGNSCQTNGCWSRGELSGRGQDNQE